MSVKTWHVHEVDGDVWKVVGRQGVERRAEVRVGTFECPYCRVLEVFTPYKGGVGTFGWKVVSIEVAWVIKLKFDQASGKLSIHQENGREIVVEG